jgi:hypothetical protein
MSIPLPASSRLFLVLCLGMVAGCAKPHPFVPKAAMPPPIVYCNDYTGHMPRHQPFVLGGSCCCTPTDELLAQLHKEGSCAGMNTADLRARYADAGIALRGDGHERCNGLCAKGPHVVLGGKCMCPPTPGTAEYERVVCGWVTATRPADAAKPKS